MEKTNNIYQKLLEVQKEVAPIKKTEANPFFNSMYFDVNGVLAALKPLLNKHGLVLSQPFSVKENGKSVLVTKVNDVDGGEWIFSEVYLPELLEPQKMGSAITYYRRYALQSLFALEAQDDDGGVASEAVRSQKQLPPAVRNSPGQFKPKKVEPTYEVL